VYKTPNLFDITALDAEALSQALAVGIILFQDFLGVDACYFDVGVA
jgi:hypothetical protein